MLLLPEVLTLREARDVLQMLEQTLKNDAGESVIIDASQLKDFDSAALAVLLECARQAKMFGKPFGVRAAPPKLGELATLYGVEDLLAIGAP